MHFCQISKMEIKIKANKFSKSIADTDKFKLYDFSFS